MERAKLGQPEAAMVIEITPQDLRDLANLIETKSNYSGIGTSVIVPISNSVSFLYNVPIKEKGPIIIGAGQSLTS